MPAHVRAIIIGMGKRCSDADARRFFDEFAKVRVSRFRAMGVIDPAKRQAVIPFPNGTSKLIGTQHVRFPNGGGYSFFVCPKCAKRAGVLYLIEDAPRCTQCCDAMNIKHTSKWGFGRASRSDASDVHLDQLIAQVETNTPLRLKPPPKSWRGRAQLVTNSQRLTERMRRRMIRLRLSQLANQQEKTNQGLVITRAYKPQSKALTAIPELAQVWRANSHERLQQALDKAQTAILTALESNDPNIRLSAVKLMLNTKQARQRGL